MGLAVTRAVEDVVSVLADLATAKGLRTLTVDFDTAGGMSRCSFEREFSVPPAAQTIMPDTVAEPDDGLSADEREEDLAMASVGDYYSHAQRKADLATAREGT